MVYISLISSNGYHDQNYDMGFRIDVTSPAYWRENPFPPLKDHSDHPPGLELKCTLFCPYSWALTERKLRHSRGSTS